MTFLTQKQWIFTIFFIVRANVYHLLLHSFLTPWYKCDESLKSVTFPIEHCTLGLQKGTRSDAKTN